MRDVEKTRQIITKINNCIAFLDRPDADIAAALQELRNLRQQIGGRGPVLLVDEDQDLLELLYEALLDSNFEVITARSGEEAVLCSAHQRDIGTPFAVAVLGLMRAKGRGTMEILPQLLKDSPQLRVILSSGNLTEASVVIIEFQHFWNHLPKPYSIGEMCRMVESAVQV